MLSDERFQLSLFREEMRLTAEAARDLTSAMTDLFKFFDHPMEPVSNEDQREERSVRVVQVPGEKRKR